MQFDRRVSHYCIKQLYYLINSVYSLHKYYYYYIKGTYVPIIREIFYLSYYSLKVKMEGNEVTTITKRKGLKCLTNHQSQIIVQRLGSNESSITKLAKEFQVSRTTIRRLKYTSKDENSRLHESEELTDSLTRKKQVYLTLNSRLKVIQDFEAGIKIDDLVFKYNVSHLTIRRIIKKKQEVLIRISQVKENCGNLEKKTLKGIEDNPVEKALFQWFLQQRSIPETVTGDILQEMALTFNKQLNGPRDFRATNGWLHRFKQRHGIHSVGVQGEKLSSDTIGAKTFAEDFNKYLHENNYDLNQVYNADESGLYYRALPKRTLIGGNERGASGHKDIKDRLTVMFAANATGSHKIPLFVIGKSAKPRCFHRVDLNKLPAKYSNQKSAWMDKKLFLQWYTEVFLPDVRKVHLNTPENPRRVILLLDNAPSHPSSEELNAIDDTCEVKKSTNAI